MSQDIVVVWHINHLYFLFFRGYTQRLKADIEADGLKCASDSGELIVAQFDALFSLNKRRNEVWVELSRHPW